MTGYANVPMETRPLHDTTNSSIKIRHGRGRSAGPLNVYLAVGVLVVLFITFSVAIDAIRLCHNFYYIQIIYGCARIFKSNDLLICNNSDGGNYIVSPACNSHRCRSRRYTLFLFDAINYATITVFLHIMVQPSIVEYCWVQKRLSLFGGGRNVSRSGCFLMGTAGHQISEGVMLFCFRFV